MMYIRGKQGIIEEIERLRDRAAKRQSGPQQASLMRDRVLANGEVGACNTLIGLLQNATLMTEAEYDKVFESLTPVKELVEMEAAPA